MVYWIWENKLGTCGLMESFTEEGVIIVDVRDLADSGEASIEAIKDKIVVIANLLSSGHKVCIRCVAGQSRSNSIACAVMTAMIQSRDWNYMWEKVREKCPRAFANLEFQDVVKKALVELGIPKERVYLQYEQK
jgi:protein-tyrosine phosphatase